jgi:hypothetical protein
MAACSQGNALAILQRQKQIFSSVPAPRNGLYVFCSSKEICGSIGANALPGNWSWTHQLFGDIKHNYPQVWFNLFPLSYR